MDENKTSWAQLVCSTDVDTPISYISTESFTIGRSKDCNLCIQGNLHISSHHCCITKGADNEVWLQDNSTNGTTINQEIQITKGQKYKLKHGDEVYIFFKKNHSECNVAFLYQDSLELQKELENDSSDLQRTDCTLEYNVLASSQNMESHDPPSAKRVKLDDSKEEVVEPETCEELKCVQTTSRVVLSKATKTSCESLSDVQTTSNVVLSKTRKTSCESLSDLQTTSKNIQITEVAPSGKPSTSDERQSGLPDVVDISKAGPSTENRRDDMEETLLCSICQDILHNAVSLQPCMHTFCAACYSSWMSNSKECPTCRTNVDRISYNHIVKNLVEVYLKNHPEKKRSEEEIKEMDAKNLITHDMVYKKPVQSSFSFLDSSFGANSSDDSDSDEGLHLPTCRQCLDYNLSQLSSFSTVQLVPSLVQRSKMTSYGIAVPMPTPPPYSCAPFSNHLVCCCCGDPFPDRRRDSVDIPLPRQSCSNCHLYFCHMYWGCQRTDCLGCLNKFKDLKFNQMCTTRLVNDNDYESGILMNYIQSKNMTYLDLFQECLVRLDSNRYTPQLQAQTTSASVICYKCGLKLFKELAYLYRKDIPISDLPNDVTSRPNCYWGKNCRTQTKKPHHARNFNHICEQTRH